MVARRRLTRGSGPSITRRSSSALLVLLLTAAAPAATLKLRTVGEGSQSEARTPLKRVFRTGAEWESFRSRQLKGARLGAVDWKREMVLGAFMGERPTSGYRVRIASAEVAKGRLNVRVTQQKPAAGAVTASVITAPYHVVAVPRHAGPVVWTGR